jgi:hypothetical protein
MLLSVAALFLATGAAHADMLPRAIAGDYCREYLSDTRVLYRRGLCDGTSYRDSASLSRTHYENGRDVECDFIAVRKIRKGLYHVRADCVDSHAAPKQFFSSFKLKILPRRNLLIAYPPTKESDNG